MDTQNPNWSWTCDTSGEATLVLTGQWTTSHPITQCLTDVKKVTLQEKKMGQSNTFLVADIYKFVHQCRAQGIETDVTALPKSLQQMLELAFAAPEYSTEKETAKPNFLVRTGEATCSVWDACVVGVTFFGELTFALLKLATGRARMRWRDMYAEILKAGPSALFIVSLISFLMGIILAFVGAIPLKWFSVELYVASLIGIGMCRMMGAVMTGTVMAGRTGAAYAAEIGTMQTNDEIDALSSMGISPMEFLVLPRFLALTIMMPLLGIFSFSAGILGGMAVGIFYLELSPLEFWVTLIQTTSINDLFIGIITSFVYGILISICGCIRGIRCGHSSGAVGEATTAAMVSSIICMVLATFVITVITVYLGV